MSRHAEAITHLSNFTTMDEDADTGSLPDLKDIESKVGRKVPDSLIRSLAGGKRPDEHDKSAHLTGCTRHNSSPSDSADLKRLESKMLFLKQEMVSTSVSAKLPHKTVTSFQSDHLMLLLNEER